MVELINQGVYLINGNEIRTDATGLPTPDEARENTITYGILRSHDVDGSKGKKMRIRFDAMMSHDITYVGIIQTARASGLEKFPLPLPRSTVVSTFPPTRPLSTSSPARQW